jgi:hypothetical protein
MLRNKARQNTTTYVRKERTRWQAMQKARNLIVKVAGLHPISFLSVYVLLAAASFSPEVSCLLVRRFASHFIEDF